MELAVSFVLSMFAIAVSIYSSRNAASKQSFETLSSIIDTLAKRLDYSESRSKKLEKKLRRYEDYIDKLIKQLRENSIVPVQMPPDEEETDAR